MDSCNKLVDVDGAAQALREFARERDWEQFHSPKTLVMALTGEVGELTEIFQWLTEDRSRTAGTDLETANKVREELADVTLYLVRLADVLGVDLDKAVKDKLQANAKRYPAESSRGSSRKSSEPRGG